MEIVLSVRQFFRLAHALSCLIDFHGYSKNLIKCSFVIEDITICTRGISISYAKKWCPLIMGENYYRSSLLYIL